MWIRVSEIIKMYGKSTAYYSSMKKSKIYKKAFKKEGRNLFVDINYINTENGHLTNLEFNKLLNVLVELFYHDVIQNNKTEFYQYMIKKTNKSYQLVYQFFNHDIFSCTKYNKPEKYKLFTDLTKEFIKNKETA